MSEHSERDSRMAHLLAVEPLDEITRRRLVRNAMDAAGPARAARRRSQALVGVAAAAVVAIVGVLALAPGSDDSPTAGRAKSSSQPRDGAGEAVGAPTAALGDATARASAGPDLLGDLGDVTGPGRLRRAIGAARRSDQALSASASTACAETIARAMTGRVGRLEAVATGHRAGAAVVIAIVGGTSGRVAAVGSATDCSLLAVVEL